MPPTESTLDCSTYKSERKEFHETKLKRLPAPYDVLGQSCATVCQGAGLAKNEELDYEPEPATSGSQYCTPGSGVANMGAQFAVMMISNRWIPPPPFTQPLSRSSTDYSTSHGLANHSTNSDPVLSTRTSVDTPITSGPVSLIETSANPDQPPELDSPPPTLKHITNSLSDTISPLVSTRAEMNSEDTTYEYENSEDVVSVIRRQPVLDKTAESNALPFVLQGYARWINRLALDPLKMTDIARDFVFGQFQDGDQSRWVIALLANIGSRIGSVDLAEGKHNHMLSVLQTAAVCGDPSNSPRVKDAFKRYMKLLNGIKPGRLPDEFLILTLKLIAAAAEQPRDREVIEQRALRLYTRDRTHLATTFIISVISDVWARADAERRPVLWSDIAVSRRQVLGV
ncbi:unnamed protein product [Rhizoctonia solani]|uniref:Uncharacterized protein n=1 Tax=Rhizoctonia solani TaxID=456999 RepID=A0A8H3DG17_9AGAM|nr:unnamed protein product [Rhizoctonia solani]